MFNFPCESSQVRSCSAFIEMKDPVGQPIKGQQWTKDQCADPGNGIALQLALLVSMTG